MTKSHKTAANSRSPNYVTRRGALRRVSAGLAISALTAAFPYSGLRAQAASAPRVVVIGAGAAGLAAASRLRRLMPRAVVTVIDGRARHLFQPGYTLVGAGLWSAGDVTVPTADYIANGVEWLREYVAEIDAEGNQVVTATGRKVPYDFLIVATGLSLDYEAIGGMSADLIGQNGIASIYAGPEAAEASARTMMEFVENGGVGLFGRPATEMKCAGAPLKYTFITDDRFRRNVTRKKAELIYAAHNKTVFAVPPVHDKVTGLFAERGVDVRYNHVLERIDPGQRRAFYRTPEGVVDLGYDFIHVVPPMRAPKVVRDSALPWRTGPFAADGWIEVDKGTLQHARFPNVFGIGDVNGVPKGKTAASVKWQTPVAIENLIAVAEGREPKAIYNGYTSCPLITGIGSAMLVEFDYDGNLTPSFPFIDPLKELWVSWAIEEKALKPTYLAMLRGLA